MSYTVHEIPLYDEKTDTLYTICTRRIMVFVSYTDDISIWKLCKIDVPSKQITFTIAFFAEADRVGMWQLHTVSTLSKETPHLHSQ
jgi:hypothetical protein